MSSPPGNIWLDLGKANTVPSCRWGGLLLRSALEHRTLLLIRPLLSQGAGRNSDACKPNLATSTCSLRPLQRVWKKRAREREGKQETSENKQPQEFHIKELIKFYPFSFLFHVNCQKREGGALALVPLVTLQQALTNSCHTAVLLVPLPPIKGRDLINLSVFCFVPIQVQLVGLNRIMEMKKLCKGFKVQSTWQVSLWKPRRTICPIIILWYSHT